MSDAPTEIEWQLCDGDGWVRRGAMHHGTDYECTGHAHFDGTHITCTNPIHDATIAASGGADQQEADAACASCATGSPSPHSTHRAPDLDYEPAAAPSTPGALEARPPYEVNRLRSALAFWDEHRDAAPGDAANGLAAGARAVLAAIDDGLPLTAPPPAVQGAPGGAELIAAERRRQVEAEGWTAEHDDEHDGSELVAAARCYLLNAVDLNAPAAKPPPDWPWAARYWRPADQVRNLVRAGALIAAEIDRLQRAAGAPGSES